MPTILDTLKKGTEYLEKYRVDEARLNMEHLIAHVLRVERMQIYLDFDRPLDEKSLEILRDLTKRRSRGEPLQHLMGSVEFCNLEFKSDARALIPRPETEELVGLILSRKWPETLAALDMGCGSGVIGLSLASGWAQKTTRIVLAEVSEDALSLARENAVDLQLENAVELVSSDLFAAVSGSFDLIVANLPYIPAAEETQLSSEVQKDPGLALYGGDTGTEIMERFLSEAGEYLNPGGLVAMEFGIDQAERLRVFAEDVGLFPVEIAKDLSGIERFLFATKSA